MTPVKKGSHISRKDFVRNTAILGVYDENNDVILLQPERAVKNGMKIG